MCLLIFFRLALTCDSERPKGPRDMADLASAVLGEDLSGCVFTESARTSKDLQATLHFLCLIFYKATHSCCSPIYSLQAGKNEMVSSSYAAHAKHNWVTTQSMTGGAQSSSPPSKDLICFCELTGSEGLRGSFLE